MRKKITFFVLNHAGTMVRQATVSKASVIGASLVLLLSLTVMGAVVVDYCRLKKASFDTARLDRELQLRQEELDRYRRHIQNFAVEINDLKTKFVSLHEFEKKVRIIANLEPAVEQESLFGIGGSLPEDLDANIPLEEKHNSLVREMHAQVQQMDLASVRQEEDLQSILDQLQTQVKLLASTPSIRPTEGWPTSRFGYRESPFTGLREFHKGLDIATRKGTPIIATANGKVTYAGKKGQMGKLIVVDHGHGVITRYGHADKLLKKRGEVVKRGDVIALVGNSGRSTGPHVHYEVLVKGVPVNPEKYILN